MNVRNIAPFIDVTFYVTSPFGWRNNPVTGQPEFHKSVDIATPYPGSELYSIINGKCINKFYSNSYGYCVIIKSNNILGEAFLYAHLKEESPLNIGDSVSYGTYVGYEGTTGTSTGIHLHIEQQDLGESDNWDFNLPYQFYKNPCDYMGIDNINGSSWYYDGVPIPPTPSYIKKRKFKFVLFRKKRRRY